MLYPKKNLIPPFSSDRWFNDSTIAGGTLTPDLFNDYRAVFNITTSGQGRLVHIPVEIGKTYIFSFGIMSGLYRIYKRKVTYHIDNLWIAKNGESFTVDSTFEGYVTLRLTNSALGNSVFENMQLEEGTVKTAFERLKWINKPAKLYPKQNLVNINDPRWTMRQGTTYVKKSGSRITWDADRDYAGYQIFLNDVDFVGKTVTFGGKRHPDTSVLLFYKKPDGSSAYVGLASFEEYRTMNIPSNAFELRFYVQNNPSTRGEFWSEDLYINIGDKVGYTPYELINKPAALVVKKNYVEPFTEWTPDTDGITVNFIEKSESRMVFDVTTTTMYKGIRMPIKWDRLKNLLGKKVTLSARTFDKTNLNNSQIQLRFTGGKANTDMVLNMGTLTTTKDVATDHTSAFLVVQMNVAGTARITLEGLQLETGDTKTDYEPLKMVNKPAILQSKKNLVPPLTDSKWLLATPFKVKGDYSGELVSNVAAWDTSKVTIPVVVGQTYYVQADITGEFSVEIWENGSVNLGSFARKDMQGRSFTARYSTWEVRIVRNNQGLGTMTINNLMVSLASQKQEFEPLKMINKPAVLYPQKNVLKPIGTGLNGSAGVTNVGDYSFRIDTIGAYSAVPWNFIEVEPFTNYTLSYDKEEITNGVGVSFKKLDGTTITSRSGNLPYTFNTENNNKIIIQFWRILASASVINISKLQLEKGTVKTAFEPYKLGNKPL